MQSRKNPIKTIGLLARILHRSRTPDEFMTVLLQETVDMFGSVAGRIVLRESPPADRARSAAESGNRGKSSPLTTGDAAGDSALCDTGTRPQRRKSWVRIFTCIRGREVAREQAESGTSFGGLIDWALCNHRSAIAGNPAVETGPQLQPAEGFTFESRSGICTILAEGDLVRGAIELLDRRSGYFDVADLDLLETVAAVAESRHCQPQTHPCEAVDCREADAVIDRTRQPAADLIGLLARCETFQELAQSSLDLILQTCHARRALWMETSGNPERLRIACDRRAPSVPAMLAENGASELEIVNPFEDEARQQAECCPIRKMSPVAFRQAFAGKSPGELVFVEALLVTVAANGRQQGAIALVDPGFRGGSTLPPSEPLLKMAADILSFALVCDRLRVDRNRLELQIQNSQKLESLGELASGISHNFRNILAGIIANCQLMEMRCPDRIDLLKNLSGIHNLARMGSELVNNLLKFARKGARTEKRVFNLAEVLEETVQIIRPSFDKKITIHSDWENPLPMEGVRSEVSQLLMNLCTNARDAMPEGGILQLTARPMDSVDKIYLAVSDTGIGMAEEVRKRIFDPFFTTKEPGTGTGLGLSTAYGIIRDHEGEITVNSQPGVGSIFQILFPIAEVHGAEKKPPVSQVIRGNGEKILIIDDDHGLLQTVEALMTQIGYQIETADSGQRGIELYCADPSDAVLIDRSMPEIDGITAAREILTFDPAARIVIVSGYEEEGPHALAEPIKSKIRAYITKPFDINDLSRIMAGVLQGKNCRQAESFSDGTKDFDTR